MARLIIDTGTLGNPATGDTLRTAMTKANTNFEELYTDLAATTSSNGVLTNEDTNGDVKIVANGTGIIEIDRLSINNTTITGMDTNANITIEPNGTGDILLKAGGQVGIGSVSSPDTDLHIKKPNAVITLQRTADANKPGIDFQNSNGNVRGELRMDGTSGTSNEVFVKTHDGSSLAERLRVGHTQVKVTGNFQATGAQIDFTALPTSDPSVAGRLWNDSGTVKISAG